MDIKELTKELASVEALLSEYRSVLYQKQEELLTAIKEEMKCRGINAIMIDLDSKFGGYANDDEWNLTYLYEDDDQREVASTVYLDDYDNLSFAANINPDGFTEKIIVPYVDETNTPAIVFSVGQLDLEVANPYSYLGEYYPDSGLLMENADENGVLHLAKVFGRCMEAFDKVKS